ncbi:piggyBac transposable element-derived protein 4-like [Aricia agestis]|uniref:piggyBac transposable element-derived protein 4-like n=1 Tax=Aricia agestis TaxID=91739 RepID=UPI001C202189|nr:piggyBac transposable element-derived protein 4-like [Aricia agestis]XP_041977212.1 piggyBac transposable element-derived protein 4-like [Aricia agestis]
METVTITTLESLELVEPIEKPLHKKTRRDFKTSTPTPDGYQSLWSSLDEIIIEEEKAPAEEAPPSPSVYVECSTMVAAANKSGHSTTPHSKAAKKRPANTVSAKTTKRRLILSVAGPSSSHAPSEEEISVLVNFGSDDEMSDDDGGEDMAQQTVFVPRATRIFMPDENETPEVLPLADVNDSVDRPPSAEIGPINKFDFRWTGFSSSNVPEVRREPFSDINCGPTLKLASPYKAFTAIWDRKIMEHIVVETNRYAQQVVADMLYDGSLAPRSRITSWRDTDADELYVFFAIILASGIMVKSRIETYWSVDQGILSSPGFAAAMSYSRFQLLSKCLHFSDNNNCNPDEMTRNEARLFKIQPIIAHLNNKFSGLYKLSQNIALDESLTQWKGWLDIKQYIPNKAATVGIKTYEICESKTGYLWRFEVHAEHELPPHDSPLSGTVPALVLKLLKGLEHKGHTVWMDNFYNSPALARELKVRGFDCVGTLRLNRQFVPNELANLTKRDLTVGELRGCTSGDVDLVVWRDKNLVALISTYHGMAAVKCGTVVKPSVVADYNVCMGGVDRKDQMLAMYPIERQRSRIWYKKFFKRLLNASVLNAFILLRSQQTVTHRKFRDSLVKDLIAAHKPPSPSAAPTTALHIPAQYGFLPGSQHDRTRRLCVVCKKRTNAYCKACNVALCVFTCFEPHHTRK